MGPKGLACSKGWASPRFSLVHARAGSFNSQGIDQPALADPGFTLKEQDGGSSTEQRLHMLRNNRQLVGAPY